MKKDLFTSGNKSAKNSLFRTEKFVDEKGNNLDEIGRKNLRSKIRKYVASVVYYFLNNNNKLSKEQISDFVDTYKEYYKINDFSLSSIYDGSDETKKKNLSSLLDYIKKNNK